MVYHPTNGGRVIVRPNGFTATVNITRTSGASTTIYSDAARTSTVAMPATISSNTTYYTDIDDAYSVSVQVGGTECATIGNGTVGVVQLELRGDQTGNVEVDWTTADKAQESAAFLPLSGARVPSLRRSVMSIGTSIMANGGGPYTSGANTNVYTPKSIMLWAMLLSGGRFLDLGTLGVGGATSAQVLANQVPTVVSVKPDFCVVQTGTNEGVLDKTSLDAIIAALLAAGVTPIITTIPPQVAVSNSHIDVNAYLIRQARRLNLPLADFHSVLVDPATGNYLSGYDQGDGVHPSEIGAKACGQALATLLTGVLGGAQSVGLLDSNANPSAAFANACFLTIHASTQPYPPWVVTTGSGWTNTYTQPTWVKGNLFTLTRGSSDVFEASDSSNDATITEGHRYLIGFKCTSSIKGVSGGATYRMTRRSDGYQAFDLGTFAEDIPTSSCFVMEWVCPTGKGGAYKPEIRALTASGAAVSIGQFTIIDLTALIGA